MNPLGLVLIVATTLFPTWQLFSLPGVADQGALFSQCLGLGALILMAWGQILATRMPGIEAVFGGLDRVYVLHKLAGIAAMAAILVHDTIDADMRGLGREKALNDIAETLGEVSLYGLLILVVISVATFVPYHLWKWTHKAMGALFVAGALHFAFILKPFAMNDPAGLYTGMFCVAGLCAYVWTLLPDRMRPSLGYKISAIERKGDVLAIAMTPDGKRLNPLPGQFGILRFIGSGEIEPHPFSFSAIGQDGTLRVSVKALGDFTANLQHAVGVGHNVRIQGPFGRFRLAMRRPEVWIAAGIGITPFLAWAAALKADAHPVDLFFCVKSRESAPHLSELEAIAASNSNLNLHVFASGEGKRISPEVIAQTCQSDLSCVKVSFCGPVLLRKSLQLGLRQFGVGRRRFHFEEFEFRTGVGLKKLAAWVLKRGVGAARGKVAGALKG